MSTKWGPVFTFSLPERAVRLLVPRELCHWLRVWAMFYKTFVKFVVGLKFLQTIKSWKIWVMNWLYAGMDQTSGKCDSIVMHLLNLYFENRYFTSSDGEVALHL